MDLQNYFKNVVAVERQKTIAKNGQLTLGSIISKLEPIAEKYDDEDEATVRFDFEYLFPTDVGSWRGSYDELALRFSSEGREMKVGDFLKMLKGCIGKTFRGYKGGTYKMDENTPVWVANYGNSGSTAVIDVVDDGFSVILMTGYREF